MQWQDPAESGIKTITYAARASMIHGAGRPFMWGWAVLHAQDSVNILLPPKPVPGHEGKCRMQILRPSDTKEGIGAHSSIGFYLVSRLRLTVS